MARMVVQFAAMPPSPRAPRALVLSYAGCSTCKKALKWLAEHRAVVEVRPIATSPPTAEELSVWVPRSGRPARKWLNTSGLSYRALDKARVAAASDEEILRWLTQDGKLVRRPVVVVGKRVLVGFDEKAYAEALGA